ncbi:MAG: DUF5989 family protein [Candidatus Acidiferrales bacterium]
MEWNANCTSLGRWLLCSGESTCMKFVKKIVRRFGIVGELFSFLSNNKRWWMLPMICLLVLVGVLIVLAQSSAIAPFIYTLF